MANLLPFERQIGECKKAGNEESDQRNVEDRVVADYKRHDEIKGPRQGGEKRGDYADYH